MADSAGGTPRATLHNGDEGGLVAAARGMGYGTGGRVGVFFSGGALQERIHLALRVYPCSRPSLLRGCILKLL